MLVVDDNVVNLKLVRVLLESAGFDVRTATDGPSARLAVAQRKPTVILMDIQMPGVDGLTVTRQLKRDPETRDILVIVLTAYAMKGDEAIARAAGADAFIAKPIDTRTLVPAIHGLLASMPASPHPAPGLRAQEGGGS